MPRNPFGHIDLKGRSLREVETFYRAFLPAVGFIHDRSKEERIGYFADGEFPSVAHFGFKEDPGHKPNNTRIAFWVDSEEEVDRVGAVIRQAGGNNIDGPCQHPEYGDYYAVFFEDPNGNKLEVYYHKL